MTRPKPESGVIGLPSGVKEAGQRVDFRPAQFDLLIETKQYRVAWSRAMTCPCPSVNDQTLQPDPNCSLCTGTGWLYFTPNPSQDLDNDPVGQLDELQRALISKYSATVIGAVLQRQKREDQPFTEVGSFPVGDAEITVRNVNKLAYRDRLIALDVSTPHYERIVVDAESSTLKTRYPVVGMNYLRSVDAEYTYDTDYTVENDGTVTWLTTPPAVGTVIGAHYDCHPTYIVVDHPHINRTSIVKQKVSNPTTPRGVPVALPVQATVRYEWLVEAPE